MTYLTSVRTRVEKDIVTRIKRSLKGDSKIYVTIGQEVAPSDIIGVSQLSSGFRTLNIADLLSVPPNSVEKFLRRKVGERVYKGELLAYKEEGFFADKKIVPSPTDGVLDFINLKTGEIKMAFFPKKVDLPAGVFGIVEFINKEQGLILIKTQASIVYGMFGSGNQRDGNLVIFGRRDGLISESDLSIKSDGYILVGGSLIYNHGITKAISSNISGIITGGINAEDYRSLSGGRLAFPQKLGNDIGISLVITEGFGSIPIGRDIFKLLTRFEGKYISLDGNKAKVFLPSFESKSIIKVRSVALPAIPEKFRISDNENFRIRIGELKVGVLVRVVGNNFQGEQGTVIAINKTESVLLSGVKAYLATIETENRKIQIPVDNLEIIDYSFSS